MRGEPGEILKDQGNQINPTGAAVSVSARRQNPEGKAKGIRPKGLTYEESGRNRGSKVDGRRGTGRLLKAVRRGAYPIETEVAI